MADRQIYRGQIWLCKLPESKGSVQQKVRPCVIVSNDIGNTFSSIVTVVPITTKDKTPLPTHCEIIGESGSKISESLVLCEQLFTLGKGYCFDYLGNCSEQEIQNINRCLEISLGLTTRP